MKTNHKMVLIANSSAAARRTPIMYPRSILARNPPRPVVAVIMPAGGPEMTEPAAHIMLPGNRDLCVA
ncbi:MAG TPA: hypothetical protein VFX51_02925 [Solirubrobacteraceae bacterium]|nr:hypothetical protein [Solirubrobacteraceae bacterium]